MLTSRLFTAFVLAVALSGVGACSHRAAPGEAVSEVCSLKNDKRVVHVSGHLVPPAFTTSCERSCSVFLSGERGLAEGVRLTFKVGAGPGTMDTIGGPPGHRSGEVRRLENREWVLRDDANVDISVNDTFRVKGQLRARRRSGMLECSMRPTAVTAL